MTLYLLCTTATGQEFAVAEGLAGMGIDATVPRKAEEQRDKKQRKDVLVELPVLSNYLFLAISEADWHRISAGVWLTSTRWHAKFPRLITTRKRVMIHRACPISQAEWDINCRPFFAAVEQDYLVRMDMAEAEIMNAKWDKDRPEPRKYLAPYNIDDRLGLLGGALQARFKRARGTLDAPLIEAEVMLFGREVKLTVAPDHVKGIAAE